ncbi:helix-turn-helix transcriptional regulator [Candidatus Enterococcus ferrettii]|uniref:HTH araC/xylS-type domain-containing protein n=1 Tax=Candidatus Enterococcus ferrettii TaxID=2815324 RepID=A0ABV0ES91_9ENTE|nr:AraC family transcriptional regulator [Enterococcus sp. 665A]MBO1340567.1 helix-turn-helix transcriptional regulator [Enterococcus sp. 665A]
MEHKCQRFLKAQDYSKGLAHLNFRYTIKSPAADSLTVSRIHQLDDAILTYSVVDCSKGIFSRIPDTPQEYLALRFIRHGYEVHTDDNKKNILKDYSIGIFDLNTISIYDRQRPTEGINLFIEKNGYTQNLLNPITTSVVLDCSNGLARFLLESMFIFEQQFNHISMEENRLILHHFLTLLRDWLGQKKSYSTEELLLNQAADYIRSYLWDATLSLERTAQACQTSTRTLQKGFQTAGLSFSGYVKDARLALAAVKLFQSNQPATSIAFQCGFNNSAYFSKCFKEKYQQSPLQYRRKMQSLLDQKKFVSSDCPLLN